MISGRNGNVTESVGHLEVSGQIAEKFRCISETAAIEEAAFEIRTGSISKTFGFSTEESVVPSLPEVHHEINMKPGRNRLGRLRPF